MAWFLERSLLLLDKGKDKDRKQGEEHPVRAFKSDFPIHRTSCFRLLVRCLLCDLGPLLYLRVALFFIHRLRLRMACLG